MGWLLSFQLKLPGVGGAAGCCCSVAGAAVLPPLVDIMVVGRFVCVCRPVIEAVIVAMTTTR